MLSRRRRKGKGPIGRLFGPATAVGGWIAIQLRQIFSILLFPFVLLFRWLVETWRHRKLKYLLRGMPALFMGGVVVILAVVVQTRADSLTDDYLESAIHATRQEEHETAKMCYERLIDLTGEKRVFQYELALTLEKLNEVGRAESIMKKLAPDNERGFADAHLWLALKMLNDPKSLKNKRYLQYAVSHLEQAKESRPNDAYIEYYLFLCFRRLGSQDAALVRLESAAKLDALFSFHLFSFNRELGRSKEAREAAERANAVYEKYVAEHPLKPVLRIRWADLQAGLGNFQATVAILQQGVAVDPDGPFQNLLGFAYVSHFRHRLRQQQAGQEEKDFPALLQLLRLALKYDPESVNALQELADFGVGEQDQEVDKLLDGLLAEGHNSAFIHFVKGARAYQKDQFEPAIFHMERAYKLDSKMATVANNLAYLLTFRSKTPDHERALRLINSVLEQQPEDPSYRETRGQILVKMGRYKEALDDLEFALPSLNKNHRLHTGLAAAYRNLGQKSLADKHAEVAGQLQQERTADSAFQKAQTPQLEKAPNRDKTGNDEPNS